MANPEHMMLLKQGVKPWNKWRLDHPNIVPDFSNAHLSDAYLSNANLHEANFRGANLFDADLNGADLHTAKLRHTNLIRADLSSADLSDADLSDADLSGSYFLYTNLRYANLRNTNLRNANLFDADLSGADLRGSDFSNANLSGTTLAYTVFGNTNLWKAKNLDECKHEGPSIIDQMTLVKSGTLPDVFLRGCGLSDEFIEQIPFLFWEKQAFEFYSCFISYSSKDEDFAKRLYADLQTQGVRCWFAPEDMKIGDKIRQRIDESIRVYDKLLLILSKNSILSDWVETEVETAVERERQYKQLVLFPIRLDDRVMTTKNAWAASIRRTRHIGDFTRWKEHDAYQAGFERLLRDLRGDGKKDV